MSISLLDALETFQGTKSLLFSQPLFEATSREGLENISSLVILPGVGKLQRWKNNHVFGFHAYRKVRFDER